MSFAIQGRIFQTNPNAFFHIVEAGVWHFGNGGTWSNKDDVHTLTMGSSGTSGMLRFMTEQGNEAFFVAMGVHNYKRWVDVETDLKPSMTSAVALPDYYAGGTKRARVREAQLATKSVIDAGGRNISAIYSVAEGHNLELNIIIG